MSAVVVYLWEVKVASVAKREHEGGGCQARVTFSTAESVMQSARINGRQKCNSKNQFHHLCYLCHKAEDSYLEPFHVEILAPGFQENALSVIIKTHHFGPIKCGIVIVWRSGLGRN